MQRLGGWGRLWIALSVLWSVGVLIGVVSERDPINESVHLEQVRSYRFWNWRITPSSQNTVWDKAAKEKDVSTWNEVLLNEEFQNLNPKEKEEAREQYWREVVLPQVKADEQKQLQKQFDVETRKNVPLVLRPNVLKISVLILLPIVFVFMVGWGIGWVRDGFKKSSA